MLRRLIELNEQAIQRYRVALERLDDERYADALAAFMADHQRDRRELSAQAGEAEVAAPAGDAGAELVSEPERLRALLSLEEDMVNAYERALAQAAGAASETVLRGRRRAQERWEWIASSLNGKPTAMR